MRYLSSVVPKGGTKEDALCVSGVIGVNRGDKKIVKEVVEGKLRTKSKQ